MFLYDKTNILEGSGIFEVDFAPSHGPATVTSPVSGSFQYMGGGKCVILEHFIIG